MRREINTDAAGAIVPDLGLGARSNTTTWQVYSTFLQPRLGGARKTVNRGFKTI